MDYFFFPSIVWYGCFTIQNHKKIDACFLLLKRDFEWRKSGVCCLQRKWLLFFFSIYGNRGIIRTVVSDLLWKQSYMRWIKETHFFKTQEIMAAVVIWICICSLMLTRRLGFFFNITTIIIILYRLAWWWVFYIIILYWLAWWVFYIIILYCMAWWWVFYIIILYCI